MVPWCLAHVVDRPRLLEARAMSRHVNLFSVETKVPRPSFTIHNEYLLMRSSICLPLWFAISIICVEVPDYNMSGTVGN